MKHLLTFTKTYWAVILVAAIGFETYGCSDSASVSEDVAVPLSSLTITPGNLQPGFFKNTTSYTFKAPTGATTVTVTATPKDSTTTMTINGAVTASGQGRSVSLGTPGSTVTILIVLSSQNGLETTYTVTVTRLLSSDNNLSALSVKVNNATQPLVPGFDANTLEYTVDVQTNVTSVNVTATKSDPNAAMLIGSTTVPAGTNPGQVPITLGSPGTITPVTIEVTAPNGSKKTYTLSIKRLAGDTNLSALNVSVGTLNPAFTAGTTLYTVDVPTNVTSVDVSATKSDPNAVMAIGSVTVPAGTASGSASNLPLGGPGSDTPISVLVTAQNGIDSKTYTVTIHRAASDDSNLLALSVAANAVLLTLTPAFDQNHLDYTVEVPFGIFEVTVTATKSDPNAVLSGSVPDPGTGVATGQATVSYIFLPPPQISVIVTAQNTTTNKTYTITVSQAPPLAP